MAKRKHTPKPRRSQAVVTPTTECYNEEDGIQVRKQKFLAPLYDGCGTKEEILMRIQTALIKPLYEHETLLTRDQRLLMAYWWREYKRNSIDHIEETAETVRIRIRTHALIDTLTALFTPARCRRSVLRAVYQLIGELGKARQPAIPSDQSTYKGW